MRVNVVLRDSPSGFQTELTSHELKNTYLLWERCAERMQDSTAVVISSRDVYGIHKLRIALRNVRIFPLQIMTGYRSLRRVRFSAFSTAR